MKYLIVDDELVSRSKMEMILDNFGDCVLAESGQQAIDEFKKANEEGAPFDLVMMDVAMPEMDGIECLKKIRELEVADKKSKAGPVKIIMVTIKNDAEMMQALLTSGCNDFILKPFNFERVLFKLKNHALVHA